jgi:hypothetical protein
LQTDGIALNSGLLNIREIQGKRVLVKLAFETFVRFKGKTGRYKRLRGNAVTFSCPNAQQAQLVMDAVLQFSLSLDGKWLVAPEPTQSATDSQSNSNEQAK